MKFLFNWYSNQSVAIKYNSSFSSTWNIKNGVRQGGILSPHLFNLYIDNLICSISSSREGCDLGIMKSNIIAYADDIVLLSPSLNGLQKLVGIFEQEVCDIKLNINANKSCCVKFINSKQPCEFAGRIICCNSILKFETEVKYLGYNVSFNMCNKSDIILHRNNFYKQFNVVLRKFYDLDVNIILNLFKTYCLQFYGSCLWFYNFGTKKNLDQFAVAYHKAIKKILRIPYGASNHDCCELVDMLTFKHFLNLKKIKFLFGIFNTSSNFISKSLMFLKMNSVFLSEMDSVFNDVYSITDILDNDLDAIISRIFYIDRREPRSNYLVLNF